MLEPIQMGTKMAAGNQQKHVANFCYKCVNLPRQIHEGDHIANPGLELNGFFSM